MRRTDVDQAIELDTFGWGERQIDVDAPQVVPLRASLPQKGFLIRAKLAVNGHER